MMVTQVLHFGVTAIHASRMTCNMSDQLYNNKHVYKHVDTMSWHGGVMAKASY